MAAKFILRTDKVPVVKAKAFKALAKAKFDKLDWKDLAGNWLNCDANTRGVEALSIGGRTKFSVRAWGSCSPTWCRWGKAKPARPYSESVTSDKAIAFTAEWDFGFSEVIMTGTFCGGCLKVQTFTHFKDGSKRYDYHSSACFFKADRATWARRTKGMI
jgi:hypothetical protein